METKVEFSGEQMFDLYVRACLCTGRAYAWDMLEEWERRRWNDLAREVYAVLHRDEANHA